ncbi:MAG: DUF1294 domain-containing protein [Clostridia bacterium]|nr:DUF1294 domain-containing protein [Clostridia bacterium]
MKPLYLYWAAVSLLAVILTCYDKVAAKAKGRRTREKTLFITAALGGSAAMYVTMLLIRHKTNHKRFMLGLPLIIALQIGLVAFLFRVGLPQW